MLLLVITRLPTVWWPRLRTFDRDRRAAARCLKGAAMPDDTTAKIAEQARAFLAWAKQETHDGLFFPEALPELKERVARILYALAQADRAGKRVEGAARLWGFFFKKEDPKEQERFRDSFQGGEPTDETFRYLQRTDFLSDVPPPSVDLISREGALKYGYAGRGRWRDC